MIMNEDVLEGDAVKPGWTRVKLSYYFAPEMVNYHRRRRSRGSGGLQAITDGIHLNDD
jgi:hypothetical protein